MDFKALECRIEPIKQTHYIVESLGNQCVKTKKKKEYDYYICDNCKEKIILYPKTTDRTGGVLSVRVSGSKELKLALCDKCLNPVRQQINEFYGLNI